MRAAYLDKRLLNTVVEQNFPDPKALDEWIPQTGLHRPAQLRARLRAPPDPRAARQFARASR
jgi:hypothetical protein